MTKALILTIFLLIQQTFQTNNEEEYLEMLKRQDCIIFSSIDYKDSTYCIIFDDGCDTLLIP